MDAVTIPSFLQEASISVISVSALALVVYIFIRYLRYERQMTQQMLQENNQALREVEREVRVTVLDQLTLNTSTMNETIKTHERIIRLLDNR